MPQSSPLAPTALSEAALLHSDDLLQAIRQSVAERFPLPDPGDAIAKSIFELAVERQSRMALSRPGTALRRGAAAPAFQTQRPPKADIKKLMGTGYRMGTLPTLFHRLIEVLNEPRAGADDVAKIIAADPALTARLLKLVNSPFYGLAFKVDTISRAIMFVGARQLVMLAMGATLLTAFKGLPVSLVNMESFWGHSITCGASARLLAKHMDLLRPESFFVAGLLHDIARLLIYAQLPAHALYLLTEARRQHKTVHELEKDTLGFTHEELGGELLRQWNCPQELVDRILQHHRVEDSSLAEELVLPASNMLAQALGYGSSGEIRVSPLSPLVWQKLGLKPESILAHCHELDKDVRELRAMFFGAGGAV